MNKILFIYFVFVLFVCHKTGFKANNIGTVRTLSALVALCCKQVSCGQSVKEM